MDFQSAMETFAEAWVAANTKGGPLSDTSAQSQALALTRNCKSPLTIGGAMCQSGCESRDQPELMHTPTPAMSVTPHADTESVVSPPSVKDGFDKTSSGKSLPVHCVVEAISSLEESRRNHIGQWRRRPVVETDSFVIIPINTPFQELVQVALHRLGYPSGSAAHAKGSVVMKNWKALSFEQISEDPVITVGDILGEMTTVATLRIQVYRSKPTIYGDIKDKLLKLLLIQSHGLLLSGGCPLDEHILSHICRSDNSSTMPHHVPEPSEECRRKFNQWWASQLNSQHIQNTHSALYGIAQAGKNFERPSSIVSIHQEHVHPAMQTVQNQYPTQKTRMRTSFDPELELPKLQRWFADNQHPSRQQIQHYVKELNCLESRRGRKPLDINNVVYWFKNARAAQKRQEIRNISPGLPCHLSVNGYNSNSHSPPNGSSLLLSNDGFHPMKSPLPESYGRNPQLSVMSEELSLVDSDLEDDQVESQHRTDEEPQLSPIAPLSLTINRKREESENNSDLSPNSSRKIRSPTKREPKEEPVDLHSSNHSNNKPEEEEEEEEEEKHQEEKCPQNIAVNDVGHDTCMSDMGRHHMQRFNSPSSEPDSQLMVRGQGNENLDRLAAGFPLVPNSMFSHSIMYMSHYIPGLAHGHGNIASSTPPGSSGISMSALAASAAEERRKRNRTFIDPVTEVPRLEQWFSLNTHPSHNLILKYTEDLNCMAYRQKFPPLEPKNVQFWFKNRRAKCKRLKMSLFDNPTTHGQYNDRE